MTLKKLAHSCVPQGKLAPEKCLQKMCNFCLASGGMWLLDQLTSVSIYASMYHTFVGLWIMIIQILSGCPKISYFGLCYCLLSKNIIFSTAACWSGLKIWYFGHALSWCLKISYFSLWCWKYYIFNWCLLVRSENMIFWLCPVLLSKNITFWSLLLPAVWKYHIFATVLSAAENIIFSSSQLPCRRLNLALILAVGKSVITCTWTRPSMAYFVYIDWLPIYMVQKLLILRTKSFFNMT